MVSKFLTPLRMEDIDGCRFRLLEPLVYLSKQHNGAFIVPAGVETDLASIPRGLWNIFPKSGAYNRAAVLHDAAYHHEVRTPQDQRVRFIKPLADKLFHEAMRADGVGSIKARWMYWAVSAFGDMKPVEVDSPEREVDGV
jgi:hypothetical protein